MRSAIGAHVTDSMSEIDEYLRVRKLLHPQSCKAGIMHMIHVAESLFFDTAL